MTWPFDNRNVFMSMFQCVSFPFNKFIQVQLGAFDALYRYEVLILFRVLFAFQLVHWRKKNCQYTFYKGCFVFLPHKIFILLCSLLYQFVRFRLAENVLCSILLVDFTIARTFPNNSFIFNCSNVNWPISDINNNYYIILLSFLLKINL